MEKMIKAVIMSLDTENYYSAIYLVLFLVGTCSKKQYPNIKKDKECYEKWLDNYYIPLCKNKYNNNFIPSSTIYQLRCSILHGSSTDLELKGNNKISNIIMTTTGSHFNHIYIKVILVIKVLRL